MGTIGRLTTPGAGARFASPGPPNAMPQGMDPNQAMPRGAPPYGGPPMGGPYGGGTFAQMGMPMGGGYARMPPPQMMGGRGPAPY